MWYLVLVFKILIRSIKIFHGWSRKFCRWINTSYTTNWHKKYILLITSVTCKVPTYWEKIWKFCCSPVKFFFSWPRFFLGLGSDSGLLWTRITSSDEDLKLFVNGSGCGPAVIVWIWIRIEFESGSGSSSKFLNKIKYCNFRDLVLGAFNIILYNRTDSIDIFGASISTPAAWTVKQSQGPSDTLTALQTLSPPYNHSYSL